jgi:hypothetical protein
LFFLGGLFIEFIEVASSRARIRVGLLTVPFWWGSLKSWEASKKAGNNRDPQNQRQAKQQYGINCTKFTPSSLAADGKV